jgi:hypothetical protein
MKEAGRNILNARVTIARTSAERLLNGGARAD